MTAPETVGSRVLRPPTLHPSARGAPAAAPASVATPRVDPESLPEEYRTTAGFLAQAVGEGRLSTVMLASCTAGEGTTTAVLKTAYELARAHGLRPLIVELDRPAPRLASLLALDPERGLGAVGAGELAAIDAVQWTTWGVAALPAAPRRAAAPRRSLAEVLLELRPQFDAVLVDAPPLLGDEGACRAAAVVRQVLLVVEAGRTRMELVDRARRELARRDAEIVGAILNKHRRVIPGWIYRLFLG